MNRGSFYSTSAFTLVDSHINVRVCGLRTTSSNLPSSSHYFGLSSYSTCVSFGLDDPQRSLPTPTILWSHASEENDNHCRKWHAQHRECPKNLYKQFIVGCFPACTDQISIKWSRCCGTSAVLISRYFPPGFNQFEPNAGLVSVTGQSTIDCNWVDPGHSSDFPLIYQEQNNVIDSFMLNILLR